MRTVPARVIDGEPVQISELVDDLPLAGLVIAARAAENSWVPCDASPMSTSRASPTRSNNTSSGGTRTLPLADGATEADIKASYKDGILEIRVPVPEQAAASEPTKITVSKN